MKVALVYDRVNKWGGAERVLLALHRLFPQAPLYTSVYDRGSASWAQVFDIETSFLQSIKKLRSRNDLLALAMPLAFESFSFDEYDVVISVTSEAAKGIVTKPGTFHICYCLTPTRYLWSGYQEYFRNNLIRSLSTPAVSYLREWDKVASSRPDMFVAISSEVNKRIQKYYGRDSQIIYPPLMLESVSVPQKRENYFLLVSRFSRASYYKKIDLAIAAFNENKLPLRIVGSGPMLSEMKRKANGNIQFTGEVDDKELSKCYQNCRALIFPGNEDFGLVMAEAQYFGAPVIAYKAGGALDIVVEGKTGELFVEQTVDSINLALKKFSNKSYNKQEILENAQKFSFQNFESGFKNLLNNNL